MTGAPMPAGADAVVPSKRPTRPCAASAKRPTRATPSASSRRLNRRRTSASAAKTCGLARSSSRGRVIRPSEVGVIASLGLAEVTVYRRPVVAILSTGDEITEPGKPLLPVASTIPTPTASPRRCASSAASRSCSHRPRHRRRPDREAARGPRRRHARHQRRRLPRRLRCREGRARPRRGDRLLDRADAARQAAGLRGVQRARRTQVPHSGCREPVSSMVSFELFGRPPSSRCSAAATGSDRRFAPSPVTASATATAAASSPAASSPAQRRPLVRRPHRPPGERHAHQHERRQRPHRHPEDTPSSNRTEIDVLMLDWNTPVGVNER